jgi:chromate transporter
MVDAEAHPPPRLRALAGIFFMIGLVGFGGQLVVLAMIRDALVIKRRWLAEERFTQGASIAQLLPGPTMFQMATFAGRELRGLAGALVCPFALILPAFLAVLVIGTIYRISGSVPAVAAIFALVGPAAIAMMGSAGVQLARSAVKDIVGAAALAAAFAGVAFLHLQPALLLVGIGLVGMLAQRKLLAAFALPLLFVADARPGSFLDFTTLFFSTGALAFGGGQVVIPLLQHDVVEHFHWLSAQQFLDGVALGQITPGPIMITATFIGLLAFGLPGALVATAGVFVPGLIYMLIARRTLARWKDNAWVRDFLSAIFAAAIGAVFGAAVLLGHLELKTPLQWVVLVLAFAAATFAKQSPGRIFAVAGLSGAVRYFIHA